MTEQETKSVLAYLSATYRDMVKERDPREVLAVWADVFREDDGRLVRAAVRRYVGQNRFAPTPADIREELRKLTDTPDMSELEAWNLVSRATRNGYYGAQEEWRKLPEDIRQIVTPENIRLWSTMDSAQFETVVQSNFMRSYRAVRQERQKERLLPEGLKRTLPGGQAPALPD